MGQYCEIHVVHGVGMSLIHGKNMFKCTFCSNQALWTETASPAQPVATEVWHLGPSDSQNKPLTKTF